MQVRPGKTDVASATAIQWDIGRMQFEERKAELLWKVANRKV